MALYLVKVCLRIGEIYICLGSQRQEFIYKFSCGTGRTCEVLKHRGVMATVLCRLYQERKRLRRSNGFTCSAYSRTVSKAILPTATHTRIVHSDILLCGVCLGRAFPYGYVQLGSETPSFVSTLSQRNNTAALKVKH